MKALRTVFHAAFAALLCSVALAGHGIMPAPIVASGGAPSAVTASYENQGSTSCQNAGTGTGCTTNTMDIYWTASASGSPTDYPIYDNGSQVADPTSGSACSGSACHYTLTITGLNCVNTPCQETANVIGVYANNGSGLSAIAYPANWIYNNGANNSCGNYSGGGFGGYMNTNYLATFTSGQNVFTVTSVAIWNISGITKAASAVVTTSLVQAYNPFNNGNVLYFQSVSGMTQINGLFGTVTATGGSSGAWTATVNINSSAFSTYTSGGTLAPPVQPNGGITDGDGAIASSAATGGPGNPYIEYFVTGGTPYAGTTGNGGTGTYYLSTAPTASYSSDGIWSDPSPNVGGGGGAEACPQTQVVESPDTYAMSTPGWAYIQQFTAAPESPGYDANWGGYSYAVLDVRLTSNGQNIGFTVHSRPGGAAYTTSDIYSNRSITILNGTTSSYGTGCASGSWCSLKVPFLNLGLGSGTWSGHVVSEWQGTASSDGSTLTIQTTTSGNMANIAANEYLMFYSTSVSGFGYPCAMTTAAESGGTVAITGCPGSGGGPSWTGNTPGYDAQAYVTTILTGTGPDNAGKITGQGEPSSTYFGATQPGFESPNTTNGTGQYGLFNLNGSTIVSAGTSGSPVTFGSNRYDIYKPELLLSGGDLMTLYFDKYGATVN